MNNKYVARVIAKNNDTYIYTTEAKNNSDALAKIKVAFKIEHKGVAIKEMFITVKGVAI